MTRAFLATSRMEPEVAYNERAFRHGKGISIPIVKSAALVGCVANFTILLAKCRQDSGLNRVTLAMACSHHSTVGTGLTASRTIA